MNKIKNKEKIEGIMLQLRECKSASITSGGKIGIFDREESTLVPKILVPVTVMVQQVIDREDAI